MRNPVTSEADAFHIVVGSTALLAVAVLLGALLSPLVGVALVAGAILGALIWEFRQRGPRAPASPLRDAHASGADTPHDRHRVLVVANRTLTSDALRAELARHAAQGAELRVVAPILASRSHYIASDIDAELADARERMRETLAWARESGVALTGRVGDPNVALGAIEDELRRAGADEVLIATLPEKQSNWLETGIVARLHDELEVPVTHLVVEPALAAPRGGSTRRQLPQAIASSSGSREPRVAQRVEQPRQARRRRRARPASSRRRSPSRAPRARRRSGRPRGARGRRSPTAACRRPRRRRGARTPTA